MIKNAAILFALINLLGLAWHLDTVEFSTALYGITASACALIVSLTPRAFIVANKHAATILIFLCTAGVGSLALLITQDYQRTYGPDVGAILLRVLFAYTFIAIGLEVHGAKEPIE